MNYHLPGRGKFESALALKPKTPWCGVSGFLLLFMVMDQGNKASCDFSPVMQINGIVVGIFR